MRFLSFAPLVGLLLAAPASGADRTRVYTLEGASCAGCPEKVRKEIEKLEGVRGAEFDARTVELHVRMSEAVTDAAVLAAVARTGLKATLQASDGSWAGAPPYPAGADVVFLTHDGSAVGPLEKLRVPGKYTVFDVYAKWCAPCRLLDEHLREIVEERTDVAIRKLDVVDFDSALARELGSRFEALPYLVIFSPTGKRSTVEGFDPGKVDKLLTRR